MLHFPRSLALAAIVGLAASPLAQADSSADPDIDVKGTPGWSLIRWYADQDTFYLMDESEVAVVDYDKKRVVRVCVDERRHMVPLTVMYGESQMTVRPGDCARIETDELSIKAAKDLGSGFDLSGTVQTVMP